MISRRSWRRDWPAAWSDSTGRRTCSAAAVEPVTRFRERAGLTGPFELWTTIKMPDDRESWRKARLEYAAAGATGIIIPSDARLLDLLRNGDEDDDRSDLGLAQG